MSDEEDCELELEDRQYVKQLFQHGYFSVSHNIADLAGSDPTHIAKQSKHSTVFREEKSKFKSIPIFLEDAERLKNLTTPKQLEQKARFRK